MKYDPERHHRRSIRLRDYDYSGCGAHFLTICTQERLCLFGDVVDGEMLLSDAGAMIDRTWSDLPKKYLGIQIDAFVIMPNHVHGIILIDIKSSVGAAPRGRPLSTSDKVENRLVAEFEPRNEGQPQGVAPTDDRRISLSDIVHRFKSFTTNRYSKGVRELGWVSFPGRLWQRNYYERVIRGNDEILKIREYIDRNPYNWDEDEENPNKIGNSQQTHATETATRHR